MGPRLIALLRFLHRRRCPALAVLVVAAAGMLIRLLPGAPGDFGGVAAYGAMMYAAVLMVVPAMLPRRALVAATLVCWAVEAFQLTGYPKQWSGLWLSRMALGVGFQTADLPSYVAGAACAVMAHLLLLRLAARLVLRRRVRELNPRRA